MFVALAKILDKDTIIGLQIKNIETNVIINIKKSDFLKYKGCFINIDFTKDSKIVFKNGYSQIDTIEYSKLLHKVNTMVLYHGSSCKSFTPTYGLGDDRHDYGRGFYLTPSAELGMEWAVCLNDTKVGYLHKYELDLYGLRVLDFGKESELSWLAELMKHRDADSSVRYKKLSKVFIEKYGINTSEYDIIKGWRADSSYFSIAKRFVRNEFDYDLLRQLLQLGNLGIQYCLKSKKAFNSIKEVSVSNVDVSYRDRYVQRDSLARSEIDRIINSDRNTMMKGFDYVLRR